MQQPASSSHVVSVDLASARRMRAALALPALAVSIQKPGLSPFVNTAPCASSADWMAARVRSRARLADRSKLPTVFTASPASSASSSWSSPRVWRAPLRIARDARTLPVDKFYPPV